LSLTRTIAIVGIAGGTLLGTGGIAEAQYHYGHHYGPPPRQGYGYYQQAPQPQYVPPRVLRKQREMEERVRRKYGYAPPYGYGQPYAQPRPYYGGTVYPYPGTRPPPRNYYYAW
jgi:hypothetical protein